MTSSRAMEPTLPGQLSHGAMKKLLGYHLAQASIPTNAIFKNHIGARFQLNKLEFTILMLVASNAEVTPKRLSVAMNIPAPNMTLILDRLENRTLVTRERSATDRRVQYVRLTEQGRAMAEAVDRETDTMEHELLRHLTEGEQAMLFELLRKVAMNRKV